MNSTITPPAVTRHTYGRVATTARRAVRGVLALTMVAVSGVFSAAVPVAAQQESDYTQINAGQPATPAQQAALDALPPSVQDSYAGYWNWMRLGPNPYADWTPPSPPWKFCYSSAFQGNDWRVAGLSVAQNVVEQLRAQGLISGDLITTDANNNASVQANQINNMVQQGCNVIFVMQPPAIGLCQAFDSALQQGALVMVMQTGTQCTSGINSDFYEYRAGSITGQWIVDNLQGAEANVVICAGIPGVAAADTRVAAANALFSQYPNVKTSTITSQWTPSVAKSAMLQLLATNPQPVNGVWNGGSCQIGTGSALQQAGRPLQNVAGFEGSCADMAFWKANLTDSIAFPQSGTQAVFEPFVLALRMLAGQKPSVNSFIYPLPTITKDNFDQYYRPTMTEQSTCNAEPAGGVPVPDSYYDPLFTGGGTPASITYPAMSQ